MEPIRSGTTTERIMRTAILTVLLVGYSLWCFWDGYSAYPHKNVDHLKENLTPVPDTPPAINRQVTKARFISIGRRLKNREQVTEAELIALLGEPAAREESPQAGSQEERFFHFGPGGMGKVIVKNGLVLRSKWFDGPKRESDLFTQFLMGCGVGAFGLFMVLQLIRVLTTRIELTDAGLKVNSQGGFRLRGSPLIPLEAMTALGTEDYKKKGSIRIEYALADGTGGTVELNDYVHRAFPRVVKEICRHRGFENPIQPVDQEEDSAAESAVEEGPGAANDEGRPDADGADQSGS